MTPVTPIDYSVMIHILAQNMWLISLLTVPAPQVEEFRVRDAEKGLKIAHVLQGFISRKVVKQTVMTVVYGVTRYGGRLQIEKRLKEIDNFPKVRLVALWLKWSKIKWQTAGKFNKMLRLPDETNLMMRFERKFGHNISSSESNRRTQFLWTVILFILCNLE